MIFEPFDVVVVPFPFADRAQRIARPALVLSAHKGFGNVSGVVVTAMITTAGVSQWPLDVALTDLEPAGLKQRCVVRMKLHTAAYHRIDRRIGTLAAADKAAVGAALRRLFGAAIDPGIPSPRA